MGPGVEGISGEHVGRLFVSPAEVPPLDLDEAEAESGLSIGWIALDQLLEEGLRDREIGLSSLFLGLFEQLSAGLRLDLDRQTRDGATHGDREAHHSPPRSCPPV